ncbi:MULTISPECIES: glycine betaine ABC transporter substrate-binding protein [Microbacterium]|uniref:glycine betaine ABC transporter substrate-binding protein n=1 Tax=Microbacterium TaxID=33882 RepID=UPI000D654DA4|nr:MULTISPECIES: glycine betaine ABC transporter substrate-binding protein [Microbacterium]
MNTSKKTTAYRYAALVAAALMTSGLAACGSTSAEAGGAGADGEPFKIAVIPGWNDYTGAGYIFKNVLESAGYEADIQEFSEIGIVYLAAANGDIDFFSASPENLQKDYWDKHKDDLEDLASWYDNNALFLAVPDYVTDVNSIEDLAAHASDVGGRIVGIEPGTGYMKNIEEKVIPEYGLSGAIELATSSSVGMLTTLKDAVENQEPVVVTSWSPFWANTAYGLKPLADPKNTLGKPEAEHILARGGFADDYPDVAAMIAAFKLDDAQVNDLDDLIGNKFGPGKEDEAAAAWLEKYPDVADTLKKALTGD